MDNKVTRRVVLGTGIAALVAGPFVMRAFRKRSQLTYSFAEEWKQGLTATETVIEKSSLTVAELASPPSFVTAVPMRYVNIVGFYEGSAFSNGTPVSYPELASAIPDRFLFRNGSFTSVVEEGTPFLSGTLLASRLIAPNSRQEFQTGEWRINTKKLLQGDVLNNEKEWVPLGACVELPNCKTLSVGDVWQGANPFLNVKGDLLDYRVVDLATVGGVDVVKVEFRCETNTGSLLKNDIDKQRIAARLRTKGYSQNDAERIASKLAGELVAEVSKTDVSSTIEGIVYVDCLTGYVLRHQLHVCTKLQSGIQHSVGIYQVSSVVCNFPIFLLSAASSFLIKGCI